MLNEYKTYTSCSINLKQIFQILGQPLISFFIALDDDNMSVQQKTFIL